MDEKVRAQNTLWICTKCKGTNATPKGSKDFICHDCHAVHTASQVLAQQIQGAQL